MYHFITGEKIQFSCELFIGNQSDFNFNPNVLRLHSKKYKALNSIQSEFDNPKIIFCYSNLLKNKKVLIDKLTLLKNPFYLVFHNSDQNFNESDTLLFEKLPLLQKIYCQNMNVNHSNVFPLPIGIANSQWQHGNLNSLNDIYIKPISKTEHIFFNFNINTNKKLRNECYQKIKKKNIPWNNNLSHKNYLENLKRYQYCICPEGNGIDTHRFWECIYLDVIPICKKNIVVEHYSQYFKIIILDDWDDLDISQLTEEPDFKHDKNNLTLTYLEDRIKGGEEIVFTTDSS